MRFLSLGLCTLVLMLTGCASSLMKPADDQKLAPIPAESSRVVFLRPSVVGGAIQASVFDVSTGKPAFVGVSSTGTKLAYDTTPGTHRFMVMSEAADFMEANLTAGKTYYAVVTPRIGVWRARFSLWPVKAGGDAEYNLKSDDLGKWLESGTLVVNTPEGQEWAKTNASDIEAKYAEYLAEWKKKEANDVAKRTLDPQDGVSAPK